MQHELSAIGAVVLGGILNGSWTVATKEQAPKALSACKGSWEWENAWFIFSIFHVIVNMVFIYGVVGIKFLNNVYNAVAYAELVWIGCLSFLWGLGGVGFGLTVKLTGVALGTSLVWAVVLVVGYLVPVALEGSSVSTSLALCTALGTALGLAALALSYYSGVLRARFLALAMQRSWVQEVVDAFTPTTTSALRHTIMESGVSDGVEDRDALPVSYRSPGGQGEVRDERFSQGVVESFGEPATTQHTTSEGHVVEVTVNPCFQDLGIGESGNGIRGCTPDAAQHGRPHAGTLFEIPVTTPAKEAPVSVYPGAAQHSHGRVSYNWRQLSPMTRGIILSLMTGVLLNMSQLVFVFGGRLANAAELQVDAIEAVGEGWSGWSEVSDPRHLEGGGSLRVSREWAVHAPLWLMLFTIGGVAHSTASAYLLTTRDTWRCYGYASWREGMQGCAVCLGMAVAFVAHIHLYGFATAYLTEEEDDENSDVEQGDGHDRSGSRVNQRTLAAAIAWPMLILVTILTGQIWSIFLGEWHGMTTFARRLNLFSILTTCVALAIVAYSGTL